MTNHTANESSRKIPYGYCHCGCGKRTNIARRTDPVKGWIKGEPLLYLRHHKGCENSPSIPPNPDGLCMCGCGQAAPIAKRNDKKLGHVKGHPVCFIPGHHNKVRSKRPITDRFWEKVNKRGPDDCWEWTGGGDQHGYGQLNVNGQAVRAHRLSYELHYGPIPDGMDICHQCDKPSCINPAHLFVGTAKDNIDDMHAKGRFNKVEGERVGNARYTNAEVREFRRQFAERNVSITAFAAFHDAPYEVMRNIIQRNTYQNA